MADHLHAVRFAHDTGMIFSEPLPRPRAQRLVERLAAIGLEAKLLDAGEASDTQQHFSRAEWDDRCVLVVPGIGTIALVRVPIDIVLPERQPAWPLAAAAVGEDDWADDQVIELSAAGRELAGLSPDKPLAEPSSPACDSNPPVVCSAARQGNLVMVWLAWSIYVMAGALWTAEGAVTAWLFSPKAPQQPTRRSRCS